MSRTVFVFPGQGSQYPGMGKDLMGFPFASEAFQKAEDVLGLDLKRICFAGSDEELRQTINTQTAIFAVSHICFELLKESGIQADMLAGHSLGEYNALVAAGMLQFEQGLEVIAKRAQLMQDAAEKQDGAMMAVLGVSNETVEAVLECVRDEGVITVANYNCPGQAVISGERRIVEKAGLLLKDRGAKRAVLLPVNGAFHTSMMQEAERRLVSFLEKTDFGDPIVPVCSNSTAQISASRSELRGALLNQMTSPVLWQRSIEEMIRGGAELFIEVGPRKVLTGLIKRIDDSVQVLNVEDMSSFESVKAVLVPSS